MKRYQYIKNGSNQFVFDNKEKHLYELSDGNISETKVTIESLSRFCPYAEVILETDNLKDILKHSL